MQGWDFQIIPDTYDKIGIVTVSFYCPHGAILSQMLNIDLSYNLNLKTYAEYVFKQVMCQCFDAHKYHVQEKYAYPIKSDATKYMAAMIKAANELKKMPIGATEALQGASVVVEQKQATLDGAVHAIQDELGLKHTAFNQPENPLGIIHTTFNGVGESVDCPSADCYRTSPVANIVMHLNDDHAWEREKIADWLDTLDVDLTLKENVA